MINISLLQEQIGDILETLTGLPAIVEEQEGHPPADNYLAYKFKGWTQEGNESSSYLLPESAVLTTYTLWTAELQVYGVGVDSNLSLINLTHQLVKDSTRQLFKTIGLTYQGKSATNPAPKQLTTGWEQRHSMTLDFTLLVSDTDSVDYVEFLEITQTVQDYNGNIVIEEDFTVDIIP